VTAAGVHAERVVGWRASGKALRASERALGSARVRLAVFAAFALFCSANWSLLATGVPTGRTLGMAAAATLGAGLLVALADADLPRWARHPLAALLALTLGVLAAGLDAALLLPSSWGRLAADLDQALVLVEGVDPPYDGPDAWIRVTMMLGAPLLLTAAAALAFWPAGEHAGTVLRGLALVLLIGAYTVAVTTRDPGGELVRGTALLALIAAWLWLPRLERPQAAIVVALVLGAGTLALPVAAALDSQRPLLDFRSWSLFGGAGITFDWSHQYGPLDWPRHGATLMLVKSDRPHYWKAQTLGAFDGVRWLEGSDANSADVASELPFDADAAVRPNQWEYGEPNAEWMHEVRFTVRSLSTELLVGVGLTYDVEGAAAVTSANGTTELIGGALRQGDSYEISAYEPDPSRLEMMGAPPGYEDFLGLYTTVSMPPSAADAAVRARTTVAVPLRGNRTDTDFAAEIDELLSDSAYGGTYALARSLTSGSATVYDAVKAIEGHLQESYRYSERVPERAYPLESFLFEDRRGYCQQFSGAMALMLRMVGIPARVVAGFSPGTLNRANGEYRVRDLDAHSWVEVYFNGIGWVPFDPTPSASPAGSQSNGALASSAAAGDAGAVGVTQRSEPVEPAAPTETQEPEPVPTAAGAGGGGGGSGSGLAALMTLAIALVAVLAGALAIAAGVRTHRRRGLDSHLLVEAYIAELRRALDRLGWEVPPGTTLSALERHLSREAGPAAAAYARSLSAERYGPHLAGAPTAAQRRAVRWALAARGGALSRLRALLAMPPGGPAPH
jgi:hypothetical protein